MSERIVIDNLADLVASVPHFVGYQPSDHVAIIAFQRRTMMAQAVVPWDDFSGPEQGSVKGPAQAASQILAAFEPHGATDYIVIGYGPNGADRARMIADEINKESQATTRIAQVDQGMVGAWNGDSFEWADLDPLAMQAELVYAGLPAPMESRGQQMAQFVPYTEPTFLPAQTETARIDATRPSERVRDAIELLRQIPGTDLGKVAAKQATLAALMDSGRYVRDAVMAEAVSTSSASVLLTLYRGAPAEYRDVTAATAAIPLFIETGRTGPALEVLDHVSPTSEHAVLANMASQLFATGLSPEDVRKTFANYNDPSLRSLDAAFDARQAASVQQTVRTNLNRAAAALDTARPATPRLDPPPPTARLHGPTSGL